MNPIERDKIRKCLKEWTERAIRDDFYPVMLITMADADNVRIERGGGYSNRQIKEFLQKLIDNLPQ